VSSETSIPGGRPFPSLRELTGTVIDGRYEVGRLLGCGGMGAVYEAMQLRLDRRVAIKILNPVYMHRDDYVTRFMREAKAASRIRHENVVQVLDFGELPSGSVYSVMEFLEGRDLAQLLQAEFKLPWPRTRDLLMQMARGLKAAHAEGVIHRDIKPANILLENNVDRVYVSDFGLALVIDDATTHSGVVTGTPQYM
jgi:serine/threonine protein kinase